MGVRGVNRLPTVQDHLAQASWAHAAGNTAAKSGMHEVAAKWYQQAAEHRGLAARESAARSGVDSHHSDVPAKGSGAHGGNPNHDEHGRFT